jgi:CRP-like cAMP-binding protein
MEKKLLDYFNRLMPLLPEEREAIAATINIQKYKKGTMLLSEGQVSNAAYFVLDGCVRQYYITENGEEVTTNFYMPEQWVTTIQSFRNQTPSNHFLSCATDASLVVGNREKEDFLYKKFPRLETVSRLVMEQVFAEHQEQLANHLTNTPEQRYARLLEYSPDLLLSVPQHQIASYIGVKPESLSRIRKRMAQKTK